jgi:hypothetical protein
MALCGCQSAAEAQADQAVAAYFQGDYEQARTLLDPIARKTDENFVLNNARLGSTTLAEYHLTDAEDAFLRAYEVINSVGVNNGGRSLGAALIDEKIKVWKGEPFERAMVNFYLGLIYYMQHDYGNARAAFENALFKLRDYADTDKPDSFTQADSNFVLAYLMLAKSWQRLGEPEKAQSLFDQFVKLRPDLAALADARFNQNANLLLVVEWGQGPRKQTAFDGSIVGFGPKPESAGPIYLPRVIVDGQPVDTEFLARPPVDLLALAQDRRWQDIDTIRAVKSALGSGLIAAGAVESMQRNRSQQELGLALIAGGLLLKATSQADIRQWEMLPRTVFLIPLHLTPGAHDVTVQFPGGLGQTWRHLIAPEKTDDTYYIRPTPWNAGPYQWPPPPLRSGAASAGP